MGIGEKMNQVATSLQDGVKNTTSSVFSISLKFLTAFFLGLTISLIAQEMIQYGAFAFIFLMLIVTGLVYKAIASWSIGATLVFDLICILTALVLRMYILLAP